MQFLSTQRQGTWHLFCHDAALTAQYLLLLPLHQCVGAWTFSGDWYRFAWASPMTWKATSIRPSHCSRPEIWSNQVTLSLLSQICCSPYKLWMFLENVFHFCCKKHGPNNSRLNYLNCPWFKICMLLLCYNGVKKD